MHVGPSHAFSNEKDSKRAVSNVWCKDVVSTMAKFFVGLQKVLSSHFFKTLIIYYISDFSNVETCIILLMFTNCLYTRTSITYKCCNMCPSTHIFKMSKLSQINNILNIVTCVIPLISSRCSCSYINNVSFYSLIYARFFFISFYCL